MGGGGEGKLIAGEARAEEGVEMASDVVATRNGALINLVGKPPREPLRHCGFR